MNRASRLMGVFLAFTSLLAFGTRALATGGFGCEIDDANLKLSVSAGLGHGMGSPMLNFMGDAQLKAKDIPEDLRRFSLAPALAHHWMADNELRLHFYTEITGDKPFASAEIVLKTSGGGEEEDYQGTYHLNIFTMFPPADKEGGKTLAFEGKVICTVE